MTKRFRSLTFLIASVFAMMAFSAGTASAQYPLPDYGVSCEPTSPAPGDEVTCTVTAAVAGESLTATASVGDAEPFFEAELTADEQGTAVFSFTVPADADGEIVVVVDGEQSGTTGTTLTVDDGTTAEEGTTVVAAPSDTLPVTGGQVLILVLLGIGLLGGGLLALRRREDAKVPSRA